MQERDGEVAGILRDLVEFLESLGDAELSEPLQNARESLLARTRAAIGGASPVNAESPEPYLEMNAGTKSLLLMSPDEGELPQEYVCADDTQPKRVSLQHYYETFQGPCQGLQANGGKGNNSVNTGADNGMDDVVLLYASFSASQAKPRSIKSGQLVHLRRERKMFAPFNVFWLNKSCYVSLVGSHLLLYANERESRPYLVVPLRGYKSRPAPSALARDPRRSEATFEIYCPGDRTFQFMARNAEDMREWVDAVTESLEPQCIRTKNRAATFVEILELEATEKMCIEKVKEEKEKYQDVLNSPKAKIKEKAPVERDVTPEKEIIEEEPKEEEAPPLPARTRRLPSLPSQERISFELKDEPYEEEGLYHRIEDVKAQREYQNCQARSGQKGKKRETAGDLVQETYDDVETMVDRSKTDEPMETYDDVQNIAQKSYDNVHTETDSPRAKSEKDKSSKSSKPVQKRSFLDRVRSRKESMMRKDDKKPKSLTISSPSSPTSPTLPTISSPSSPTSSTKLTSPPQSPPPVSSPVSLPVSPQPTSINVEPELPCYDDVSNFSNRNSCASPTMIEEDNYLSPPPPRPIYSRPPTIIKCAAQADEIYDDIGSCIEMNGNGCKGCANVDVIKNYPKNSSFLSDLQLSIDQEHYQVPKSGNRRVLEQQEELYDDVRLSQSFKNRQRESVSSPNSERSIWSRLGGGRGIFNHMSRQTSCSESESVDENSSEQQAKMKPIQKLINKMETTLGKATKVNGVS